MNSRFDKASSVLFVFICLIPWAVFQSGLRIPGDVAFLFHGADMLSQGKLMTEYFFDNNPPMSFLIYSPAVLLKNIGISPHNALLLYGFILSAISIMFFAYLLERTSALLQGYKITLLITFSCLTTILTFSAFLQKDVLIAVALVIFTLLQFTLSEHKHTKFSVIIALFCVPFILLKPHFLMAALAVPIWRVYTHKNIRMFFQLDMIVLFMGGILYIAFVAAIMPDFFKIVLPESTTFYISTINDVPFLKYGLALGTILVAANLYMRAFCKNEYILRLFILLSTLSGLSFIIYCLQGKGFSLHLYPASFSLILCLSIMLHMSIKDRLKLSSSHRALLIFALFYTFVFIAKHPQTKNEVLNSDFSEVVQKHAKGKAFFFESYSTNIFWTYQLYTDNVVASRFPSLWFLSSFAKLDQNKQKHLWLYYGRLIAEDIDRYKPALFAARKPKTPSAGLVAFLKNHPDFQESWEPYKLIGTHTISKDDGYDWHLDDHQVTYDLYVLEN